MSPALPAALKPALAFCVTALCLWMLAGQIQDTRWTDLRAALATIDPWQWAVALGATLCSFLAIGQYDVVWHRHLRTGVSDGAARRTGMAAVAVAQTIGLGTVTGTFLRWHMLSATPMRMAAAVTIGVSLSFLLCWAGFAVIAGLSLGLIPAALGLSALTCLLCAALLLRRRASMTKHLRPAPRLIWLTGLDLMFAAVALWVLLPDPSLATLPLVAAAFILAVGAGLISNAPGGIGAFELVLLALLTTVPETTLLAAILGFRLVYYGIPALCGAGLLLASHLGGTRADTLTTDSPTSDLIHQGATIRDTPAGRIVIRPHLLGTVALEPQFFTPAFRRPPGVRALYKCAPRIAAEARRAGWTVRRIASDALIDPQTWTSSGPARSQLRRKLRQAQKAGVHIHRQDAGLDFAEMDPVAANWAAAHGGELGYSMGRYTHDYIQRQPVYLIRQHGHLRGFISVQARASAWVIDIIRHDAQLPPGAMHTAVTAIISDAATAGVATLSLGAVPDGPAETALQQRLIAGKAGLRQFKDSFGPTWSPRYHAAPAPLQLGLSLLAITLRIQRPLARLKAHLAPSLTNFINITRIIHLLHNKDRGTSNPNTANEGAYCDGRSTLEPAG